MTLWVAYTGSHGYHQLLSIDANLPNGTTPYPTQVITATSTGLANPAVWNTTHWFSEGIQFLQWRSNVDVNPPIQPRAAVTRHVHVLRNHSTTATALNTSVATNSPAFASDPRNVPRGLRQGVVRHSELRFHQRDLRPSICSRRRERCEIVERKGSWKLAARSAIETLQSGIPFTPRKLSCITRQTTAILAIQVRPFCTTPHSAARLSWEGRAGISIQTRSSSQLRERTGNAGRNILTRSGHRRHGYFSLLRGLRLRRDSACSSAPSSSTFSIA